MNTPDIFSKAVIPSLEIGSYEALWMEEGASFAKLATKFKQLDEETPLPSEVFHDSGKATEFYKKVMERVNKASFIRHFGVRFNQTLDYPERLKDAKDPLVMFYYAGNPELIKSRSIAVVGTRSPSPEGILRTQKLVKALVDKKFTIISGLAAGIDTHAHTMAIELGGNTIAVLGTPLDVVYPKENIKLLQTIIDQHVAISQVPFVKYAEQSFSTKRFYFPERNKTMSALSEATVIVEAGETSGTLVQARASLEQGRKLFILASCFDKNLTWPEKFLAKGAIKVNSMEDIWAALDINNG